MTQDPPPAAEPTPELPVDNAPPDLIPLSTPAAQRPFSILALLALIGGLVAPALACLGSALVALAGARAPAAETPLFVSIMLTVGLAGLPLAWEAGQRLRGKTSRPWLPHWTWIAASLAVIVVSLVAGQTLISLNILPALAAGLAQSIIFLAAAAGIVALAGSGWGGLSRLRAWGYLLTGAWLSVFLAFVAEVLVIGLAIVFVLVVLAAVAPAQLQALAALARSLSANPNPRQLTAWLLKPWVIGLAYLFAAVVIPLIEELLKSLGAVFFIGQKPAPMTAYMGGLMGGLGFAITESLSNLASLQNPWAVLVVARLGTLAMHSFTSSLVGWGWGQLAGGRPGRLGLAYLTAVGMHGLWNAAVVTLVFGGLTVADAPAIASPATMGVSVLMALCVILLVALVPACLVGLAWLGRRLRTA